MMGIFIDGAAILLVTVPIFMPIAMEMEFNPLWFSILMCVNLQTSFLTPPFGYALFYFKGVAPPAIHHDAYLSRYHAFRNAAVDRTGHSGSVPGSYHLAAGVVLRKLMPFTEGKTR